MSQFIVLDGDGKICPIYKGEEMNPYEILTYDEVRKVMEGRPVHVFELVPVSSNHWELNEGVDVNPEPTWPFKLEMGTGNFPTSSKIDMVHDTAGHWFRDDGTCRCGVIWTPDVFEDVDSNPEPPSDGPAWPLR